MSKLPSTTIYAGKHQCKVVVTEWVQDDRGYNHIATRLEKDVPLSQLEELFETVRKKWPNSNFTAYRGGSYYQTRQTGSITWAVLYGLLWMNVDRLLPNELRGGCH